MGCIEEVKYKSGANETYTDAELLASDEVKPGCMNACEENVCPNGGKCINYFTEYRCDCIGTGFTGPSCQKGEMLFCLNIILFVFNQTQAKY